MPTSEPRAEANPEKLCLVDAFLFDRRGQVKPDRTDGRGPGEADADARTDRRAVEDRRLDPSCRRQLGGRQHDILLVVAPEGSEIAEYAAGNTQFLRQPERNAERHRTD